MEISSLSFVDKVYPVGSIYMSVNSINPSELFGGEWVEWGAGRVPIGVDTNDTDFESVEKTGGNKTVSLTLAQIPSHKHTFSGTTKSSGEHNHRFNARSNTTAKGSAQHGLGTESDHNDTWSVSSTGAHTHTFSGTTQAVGSGNAHDNVPPYITCYMWKRTA